MRIKNYLFYVLYISFISNCALKTTGENRFFDYSEDDSIAGEDTFIETTRNCTQNDECNDLNPCNGEEYCGLDGFCHDGNPLVDGTQCTTRTGQPGVCKENFCVPESCGNGEKDTGEECDDGNKDSGDGCEPDCTFSCHGNLDCSDSNPCTDEECLENGNVDINGKICQITFNTNDCDDGNPCTITDKCNGAGECKGSGNKCDDNNDCTTDTCIKNGSDYSCENSLLPGYCLIDSECHQDGEENFDNPCQVCDISKSTRSWTNKNDMENCTGGICCNGNCIIGGECCDNWDCHPFCDGTALDCSNFDSVACTTQTGCLLNPSTSCTGTVDCSEVSDLNCTSCGCVLDCVGPEGDFPDPNSPNCFCYSSDPINPPRCESLSTKLCSLCGCSISTTNTCTGIHHDCSSYNQTECNSQRNCQWKTNPTCSTSYTCI